MHAVQDDQAAIEAVHAVMRARSMAEHHKVCHQWVLGDASAAYCS